MTDIKQRLRFSSNPDCRDALAEIERLERIPAALRELRRYRISQGIVIDPWPDDLVKWRDIENILRSAGEDS